MTIQTVTSGSRESSVDVDERVVVRDTEYVRSHRIAGNGVQFPPAYVVSHADRQEGDAVATGGRGGSQRVGRVRRDAVEEDDGYVAVPGAIAVGRTEDLRAHCVNRRRRITTPASETTRKSTDCGIFI